MSTVGSDRADRRFLRPVGVGDAEAEYERFVADVAAALDDPAQDRNDVVRDVLHGIYGIYGIDPDPQDPGRRALLLSLDPRHATLEPEYYKDIDGARYEPLKPLHWLWIQFDLSPLGRNLHLGVLFRRMLAERVFSSCGHNVKIFHGVEITYGYNLEVGDDVVIHRCVLLDDRGGLKIGNRVSISDYANIYTHDHHVLDIGHIAMKPTTIGDGARITYHATVLAGAHVGEDAIVGAHGLLRKPLEAHAIAGGVPAKPLGVKHHPGKSV